MTVRKSASESIQVISRSLPQQEKLNISAQELVTKETVAHGTGKNQKETKCKGCLNEAKTED